MPTIAELQAKIETKTKQVADFSEALQLIKGDVKYTPVAGELPPFDKMKQLMDAAGTEAERAEKIKTATTALNSASAEKNALQIELEKLVLAEKLATDRKAFIAELVKYDQAIAAATQAWAKMTEIKKSSPTLLPNMPSQEWLMVAKRGGVPKIEPLGERFKLTV